MSAEARIQRAGSRGLIAHAQTAPVLNPNIHPKSGCALNTQANPQLTNMKVIAFAAFVDELIFEGSTEFIISSQYNSTPPASLEEYQWRGYSEFRCSRLQQAQANRLQNRSKS
jgi:hypothetical protein